MIAARSDHLSRPRFVLDPRPFLCRTMAWPTTVAALTGTITQNSEMVTTSPKVEYEKCVSRHTQKPISNNHDNNKPSRNLVRER
jgi:hypothetical protein